MPISPVGPSRVRGAPGLGRWAVNLTVMVLAVIAVSSAIFGAAYAVGGDDAISDTWVGHLTGIALLGRLGAAFVAFVMAIVAMVRHAPQAWLW